MVLDIEESMFETCLITHKEHQNSLELEQRELSQLSSNQAELLVYYNKEAAEVSTLVETERERERETTTVKTNLTNQLCGGYLFRRRDIDERKYK